MKHIFTTWTLLGALGLAAVLMCGTLLLILALRPADPDPNLAPAAPALTLIPPPTSTPHVFPPTGAPPSPTPPATATARPGELAVGVYIQISGTNGEGLRLRPEPGLDSQPLALGYDSEVFLVADGPQHVDNLTWWLLVSPYDEARGGWAAADFLSVIDAP